MSHASVLVVTDARPTEEELQEILLPWHEYECTGIERYVVDVDVTEDIESNYAEYGKGRPLVEFATDWNGAIERDGRFYNRTNSNRKWDWWVIGGRYGGCLTPRPSSEAYRREESRTGGKWGPDHGHGRDGYDQLRWSDLDLEGMLAEAQRKKGEEWDGAEAKYREKAEGIFADGFGETLQAYEAIVASLREDPTATGALYERIEANPGALRLHELVGHANDVFGDYAIKGVYTREAHVATAVGLSTFAVVKNGQWAERGQLGWFGSVADEKDDWPTQLAAIFETIRPDQWVTIVDYHI